MDIKYITRLLISIKYLDENWEASLKLFIQFMVDLPIGLLDQELEYYLFWLHVDLDLYEPDPIKRSESKCLYNKEGLPDVIAKYEDKLLKFGINLSNELDI